MSQPIELSETTLLELIDLKNACLLGLVKLDGEGRFALETCIARRRDMVARLESVLLRSDGDCSSDWYL